MGGWRHADGVRVCTRCVVMCRCVSGQRGYSWGMLQNTCAVWGMGERKSEIKEGDPREVHDDSINKKQADELVGIRGLDAQKRSKTGRYALVHIRTHSDGGGGLRAC